MTDMFVFGNGKYGLDINHKYDLKVGSFGFPPFGFLDLYANMQSPVMVFYMKPRLKDPKELKMPVDVLGPVDIIKFYRETLDHLEKVLGDYIDALKKTHPELVSQVGEFPIKK